MRIALIQFVYYEYLGLMYLSSCLKRHGHAVEVFIPSSTRDTLLTELLAYRPDAIGFSVMSGHEEAAIKLTRMIKTRANAYVIFGGPHPTHFPEIIEAPGLDCVCLGEAEATIVEIMDNLSRGHMPETVPGAWCKIGDSVIRNDMRRLEEQLEDLPRPDRTLYNKYRLMDARRVSLIAGRGCPYSCTFCFNSKLHGLYQGKGRYVRLRPVDDVIDEIKEAAAATSAISVYFQDDTFTLNKPWLEEFLAKYQSCITLPFSCQIRADTIDEGIVKRLKDANCKVVSFGIETGNEKMRHALLKKGLADRDIIICAALLKKHGIKFRSYNILGLPGEGLEGAFQTVRFNESIGTDYPWCSIYQPLPGTELADHCETEDLRIREERRNQPSFFKSSPLRLERKNEIVNLHKLFFYAVKFPRCDKLIRAAIRRRPNALYDLLFLAGHAWTYYFSELVTFRSLFSTGTMNVQRYLGRFRI